MKYAEQDSPIHNYERVPYGAPAPRCSLSFFIQTLQGQVIDDSLLRLESFTGKESLSQPFEFTLELRANDYTASGQQIDHNSLVQQLIKKRLLTVPKKEQSSLLFTPQAYGETLDDNNVYTAQLNFDEIVGASATIFIETPDTTAGRALDNFPEDCPVVCFNGIITNFALAERGVYHATLKADIFRLGLQNNYRIFADKTILEVISHVLIENNIKFNQAQLSSPSAKLISGLACYRKQDWLQAGETDLEFISRLMQKVSLFYYFTHDALSHTMVLTDQPFYQSIYQRQVNQKGQNVATEKLKSLYLSYCEQGSLARDDYIHQFSYQQNLVSSGVTTVLAQKEATWESQNTAQVSPVYLNSKDKGQKLNIEQLHLVQYGASEQEFTTRNNMAVNQITASKFSFTGSSSTPELKAGHKFQVQEATQMLEDSSSIKNYVLPIRPILNQRIFAVTSVQHKANALGEYKNQFSAVAAEGIASPFNEHDGSLGNILAIVAEQPKDASNAKQTAPSEKATTVASATKPLSAEQEKKQVAKHFNVAENLVTKMMMSFKELATKENTKASTGPAEQSNDTKIVDEEYSHKGTAAKYLEKAAFFFDSKRFHFGKNKTSFKCRGIYVRFIDQPENSKAQWIKLAEHMQTVPEVGSYVVIGRSNDDNEIPEVQQSLQAKGSKVIMPEKYTCHTQVGNSFNTAYGNNTSINFGADSTTKLSTAQHIVDKQRTSDNYHDIRYAEGSSYRYEVNKRNHSIAMTGTSTRLPSNPANMMAFVTYSNSITEGNTLSESVQLGAVTQLSTHSGAQTSVSNMNGATSRVDNVNGATSSVYIGLGAETNVSTKTGIITNVENINGLQIRRSLITGSTNSSTIVIGSSTETSNITGNSMTTSNVTGNRTSTSMIEGLITENNSVIGSRNTHTNIAGSTEDISVVEGNRVANNITVGTDTQTINYGGTSQQFVNGVAINKNQTIASQTENNTVGVQAGTTTVATKNEISSVESDNSVASVTNQNVITNISSGTTTVNDSSINTKNQTIVTEIADMRTFL